MQDSRIVMTLDAGGTNFVFSALQGGNHIVTPLRLPAEATDLDACLNNLVAGFKGVLARLPAKPVAISFAFPGPADYQSGIISGDLPNFPCFRGGVAMGPYLKQIFDIPVFINNDGSLFAYGEALTGALPYVNARLREMGSIKQFNNLIGFTLGTGFGGGIVVDGHLLIGDNATGGDVYCLCNKKYPDLIAEEGVSIRAVKRVYRELSGDDTALEPVDIYNIAEGKAAGDREAAIASFAELGEIAGDVIATAVTLVDGIVVLGGGLTGAARYIMPSLLKEMRRTLGTFDGQKTFGRVQMKVFDLDDEQEFSRFALGEQVSIPVYGSNATVDYDPQKRTGVIISKQGASHSVAAGAYVYALNHLQ